MRLKAAIFDMDGVLFDTEKLYQETWKELAMERHISLGDGFLMAISGTNGSFMKRTIEKYYQVADGTEIMEACMARMKQKLEVHVPVKKGVYGILEYFHRMGMRIAVASSSSVMQIEANLRRSGMRDYFTEIISGTEVQHGKPSPDIFLLAARRLGFDPQECLVFEDSENGVKAGHQAGCFTVMIPDLIEPSEEIRELCSEIYPDFLRVREEIEKYISAI